MKSLPGLVLVVVVVASALSPSFGAWGETLPPGRTTSGAFPYAIKSETLPNGLEIAVVKTEPTGMFSLREVVGVGSRDEVEPGHSGFAHFFEHMMFRGTKRWPAEQRGDLLESLGVNEGGSTTDDFTIYQVTGPVRALAEVLALEADRYQHLEYSEADFKTEAKAVLGEYNKSFSNPDMKAWEELRALAYDKHSYEHTVIGFLDDVERMPERYEHSKKFFERFYTPDNTLLIVAGDVDPDVVIALVKEHFSSWQGKRAKTSVPAEPAQRGPRKKHVEWPSPTQPRAMVAWKIPSALEPRTAALLEVLEAYLVAESSPLYKALVIDEQKAEGLESWWGPKRDPSLFPVVYRLREGASHDDVIPRLQQALDEIAAGKVDAQRFEAVKSNARYSVLLSLVSADAVASAVGWRAGLDLDPMRVDRVLGAMQGLAPPDLTRLVKGQLDEKNRTVITLAAKQGGEG